MADERTKFVVIRGGLDGGVPEPVSPIVTDTIAFVRDNIDRELGLAFLRSRVEGTLPLQEGVQDPYSYFDAWLRDPSRGLQTEPVKSAAIPFGPSVESEAWHVRTGSDHPRVLFRFYYQTNSGDEGYAYFVEPINQPIDHAIGYQSSGFGDERTWHQTNVTTRVTLNDYYHMLLNPDSKMRMVRVGIYKIDFPPAGGGGGLETEDTTERRLAA